MQGNLRGGPTQRDWPQRYRHWSRIRSRTVDVPHGRSSRSPSGCFPSTVQGHTLTTVSVQRHTCEARCHRTHNSGHLHYELHQVRESLRCQDSPDSCPTACEDVCAHYRSGPRHARHRRLGPRQHTNPAQR